MRNSGVHTPKHARIPHTTRTDVQEDQRLFHPPPPKHEGNTPEVGEWHGQHGRHIGPAITAYTVTLLRTIGTPENVVWRGVGNFHANDTPNWRGLGRQCRTLYQAPQLAVCALDLGLWGFPTNTRQIQRRGLDTRQHRNSMPCDSRTCGREGTAGAGTRGEACCPLNGDIVACRAFIASAIPCRAERISVSAGMLQVSK